MAVAAAGSNHGCSQTADYKQHGLEASQLRSQREHPHSCSEEPAVRPGEGLERLREPGRPGRHTSRVGCLKAGANRALAGQMSTSHQEKASSPQFPFRVIGVFNTGWGNKMFQLPMGGRSEEVPPMLTFTLHRQSGSGSTYSCSSLSCINHSLDDH